MRRPRTSTPKISERSAARKRKKMRGNNNAGRGARAVDTVAARYRDKGYRVRRTEGGPLRKGADLVVRRGRRRLLVEVKTGTAKLSREQRAARRRVGASNYVVERSRTRILKGRDAKSARPARRMASRRRSDAPRGGGGRW